MNNKWREGRHAYACASVSSRYAKGKCCQGGTKSEAEKDQSYLNLSNVLYSQSCRHSCSLKGTKVRLHKENPSSDLKLPSNIRRPRAPSLVARCRD